jgi:hypothetical protein
LTTQGLSLKPLQFQGNANLNGKWDCALKRKTVKRADGETTEFCGERVEQEEAVEEAGEVFGWNLRASSAAPVGDADRTASS